MEVLEQWSQQATSSSSAETIAAAEELQTLLTSYEMEGLLLAHDSAITQVEGLQRKNCTAVGYSDSPGSQQSVQRTGSPSVNSRHTRPADAADTIKIIKIEKTNEPLGATVRNEGDAVIIGRFLILPVMSKARHIHLPALHSLAAHALLYSTLLAHTTEIYIHCP